MCTQIPSTDETTPRWDMGFAMIIRAWKANPRTKTKARLAAKCLKWLRAAHRQAFANLDKDPFISTAKRKDLLEQLLVAPATPPATKDRVETFCLAHLATGPRDRDAEGAALGHVRSRARCEASFSSAAMPRSPFTRSRRSPSLAVDYILSCTLPDQRKSLGGIYLSDNQMWSFYQHDHRDDAFSGISKQRDELVRRLGLGSHRGELLLWQHRLDWQEPRTPTAFDAGLDPYFRPGGRTRPLSGRGGLSEVVHPPITGWQLTSPIEKAK